MAERTTSTRSSLRKRAQPYPNARPVSSDPSPPSSKASLSSIFSGLFSFITRPFGRQQQDQLEKAELPTSGVSESPSALALHDRGEVMENEAQASQQPQQNIPLPPPPRNVPPPPRREPEQAAGTSGTSTYGTVAAFLAEKSKGGQRLNEVELAGVMTLLKESANEPEEEKPWTFRFSSTLAAMAASAAEGAASSSASAPSLTTPNETKRAPRMLSKNPNGPYRWNGAASARPRRYQNRYASPAFGAPRSTSHITLTPKAGEKEKAEVKGKKRRVDEQASKGEPASQPNGTANGKQAAVSSVPFPSTSNTSPSPQAAPRTNGASALPSTPPRIRAAGLQTKPAVPSPLRQTWRAEPESPPQTITSTSATRPTRAAAAMVELIKEASPKTEAQKRREAFANPYEALSPVPVKPVVRKILPRKRKVAETEKPEEKAGEKKQQKEEIKEVKELPLSPQKIIEATVPKGAKRSRPPPELERKTQAAPEPAAPAPSTGFSFAVPPRKVSPPQPSIVVEEIPDEESPRKKSRGAAVNGVSKARTVTVEEVEDVEMQFVGKPTPSVVKPSQVIEIDGEGSLEKTGKEKSPSPTSSTSVNGFAGPAKLTAHGSFKSSAPRVSSKLRYSFAADKEEAEEKGEDNGKGKERALFADTTDTSGLDLLSAAAVPSAPRLAHAQLPASSSFGSFNRAPATGTSLLGTSATFGAPSASTFSAPTLAPSPFLSSTRKPAPKTTDEVKNVVRVMSVLELPTYNFDVPLSSPGAGPSTIKARQTAEAEPASALPTFDLTVPVPAKPVPVSVPSAVGFDWAAAGMKKPTVAGDQWKCSLCSCSNPASAVDCTVCNEPRPKAPAASTSSSGGFNWAAAGMKPPEKKADEWKCSDCMCSNPASATEKCTVCEAPRPGAIKATPPVSGFDWAAAGMKKPQNDNGWTCSVCMVNNKADAKKCIACESDR